MEGDYWLETKTDLHFDLPLFPSSFPSSFIMFTAFQPQNNTFSSPALCRWIKSKPNTDWSNGSIRLSICLSKIVIQDPRQWFHDKRGILVDELGETWLPVWVWGGNVPRETDRGGCGVAIRGLLNGRA
jgi:hypothetical protein